MDYTVRINQANKQIIPALIHELERQKLRGILTFDFQHARSPHLSCNCPHHGTDACNCQYAVLLVYDPQHGYEIYRTITIHGRDEQVWLSLLQKPASARQLEPAHQTLEAKLLAILFSLAELPHPKTMPAGHATSPLANPDGEAGRPGLP